MNSVHYCASFTVDVARSVSEDGGREKGRGGAEKKQLVVPEWSREEKKLWGFKYRRIALDTLLAVAVRFSLLRRAPKGA
jgi:hypothetical protein